MPCVETRRCLGPIIAVATIRKWIAGVVTTVLGLGLSQLESSWRSIEFTVGLDVDVFSSRAVQIDSRQLG